MTCQVCGRDKEELEEEFGIDITMEEHQGIDKCSKCIEEYERELGRDEEAIEDEEPVDGDWKNKVVA